MREKQILLQFSGDASIGKKIYLPRVPEICNSITYGFSIPHTGSELSTTFVTNGTLPIAAANLKNIFITLANDKNEELYKDLPLWSFLPSQNNGIIRTFMNARISTDFCFIRTTDATGIGTTRFLLLNFYIS